MGVRPTDVTFRSRPPDVGGWAGRVHRRHGRFSRRGDGPANGSFHQSERGHTDQSDPVDEHHGRFPRLAPAAIPRRRSDVGGYVGDTVCEEADWVPETQEVRFEALINIRIRQGNPSMEILDPQLRGQVKRIADKRLGKQ